MRFRTRSIAALIAAFALLQVASASAAPLPADTTAILSGAPSLFDALPAPVGHAQSWNSSVSQDGRFVAFQSSSDGLYEGDDDSVTNVYVKDRSTGVVILASRATGATGEPAHESCYQGSISDDGTRVAFTCEGALDAADTNKTISDVYVRELTSSTTYLVSRASGLGAVGDRASSNPALSETGEYVAFESESTNLDPGATQGRDRVYRRQIGGANATVLVSRSATGAGAEVGGHEPSISDDGNRIAFTSDPGEVVDPADTNSFQDVYVRDVGAGTTVLASRADGSGAVGNGNSRAPSIAGDGTSVAFETTANEFDHDHDPDTKLDVYRRSLTFKTTALVSISAAGQKGLGSFAPALDDTGDVVAFASSATALDPADTDPARDAYVKNLTTNEMQVASRVGGPGGAVANAGVAAVAMSGDGKNVAIGLDSGAIAPDLESHLSAIALRDLATQQTYPISRPRGTDPFVNQGGFAVGGALSADGRYAAFLSQAPALGLPAGTTVGVFVRDRVTGAVTLASRADGASGAPLRAGDDTPAISGDGRRVAFSVVSGQDRGVYVRDLATNRTFLASRADGPNGEPANGDSAGPALDADGARVSFMSNATNLGDGDADNSADVHVRDLESGRTILASRGADGAKANGESGQADLSADGTRVAFLSFATNLADGDTDDKPDVHLRDLAAGTTRLVSAAPGGAKNDGFIQGISIDDAGRRIAFGSTATTLPGGNGSNSQVYVRDLAADTLVLASRGDGAGPGAAPGSGDSVAPVVSPDGGYVVFASRAANLVPGLPAGAVGTFVRDLTGSRTELLSRESGTGGAPATGVTSPAGVSTAAGCVSFYSEDALIGPDSDYGQVYLRARRADCSVPATGGGGTDTVAPVLSGARLTRKRFRVGRARTAVAARRIGRGTVLRFRSTEAGTASLTFARTVRTRTGRTRMRSAGRLTRAIVAGQARVALSGRLGRRAMRAGRYRLTLQVRDAAGNASRPVRLSFQIKR